MKKVRILEDGDCIRAEDWCRPIGLMIDHDGQLMAVHPVTKHTVSNTQWIKVKAVIGKQYFGQTVAEVERLTGQRYEVLRGHPPFGNLIETSKQRDKNL